jgi:hypothetical protein
VPPHPSVSQTWYLLFSHACGVKAKAWAFDSLARICQLLSPETQTRYGAALCLPDINFGAATAHRTHAGIGIVGGRFPAFNVGLAANKLEIAGALGVAVLSPTVSGLNPHQHTR